MDYHILAPEFDDTRNYILENQGELKEKYGSDYIAVFGEKVIDFDPDKNILESRLRQRTFKDLKPFIGTIEELLTTSIKLNPVRRSR